MSNRASLGNTLLALKVCSTRDLLRLHFFLSRREKSVSVQVYTRTEKRALGKTATMTRLTRSEDALLAIAQNEVRRVSIRRRKAVR